MIWTYAVTSNRSLHGHARQSTKFRAERVSGLHELRSLHITRATHNVPPPTITGTVIRVIGLIDATALSRDTCAGEAHANGGEGRGRGLPPGNPNVTLHQHNGADHERQLPRVSEWPLSLATS